MGLVLFSFFSCTQKTPEEKTKSWISEHAIPLKTVEPGNGFEDLAPFGNMVGDARIVSLGEPTHGNREVFQLKHRLIEYLVTEKGFNLFTLECPFAEAYDINRYVVEGIGDPKKALAGIYFWPWDTEEVLALIEWMRAYNADPSHEKKVKFYGFDVQDPERAARVLLEYLEYVDPELWQAVTPELSILQIQFSEPVGLGRRPYIPEEYDDASIAAIKQVMAAFEKNKGTYISKTSEKEWVHVQHHARQVELWIDACANDGEKYVEIRDLGQSENIQWLLEQEGEASKAIVWAHNCHISNAAPKGDINMHGYYLRKAYGDQLKIVGLFFNQGGFKAIDANIPSKGVSSFTFGPAPVETLEHVLASAQHSISVLDLDKLPEEGPVHDWFFKEHPTRHSGGGYNEDNPEEYFWSYVPAIAYDALVYLETTTPVTSINDAVYDYIWMLDKKLDRPTNLSFENDGVGEAPQDWMVWSKFQRLDVVFEVTDKNPFEGRQAVRMYRPKGIPYGEITPSLTQRIDATPYRGKKIIVKAATRAEVEYPSFAFFRLVIESDILESAHDGSPPLYDNLDSNHINSSDWKVLEIETTVPEDASTMSYGIYLRDFGTVWLDAIRIEIIND